MKENRLLIITWKPIYILYSKLILKKKYTTLTCVTYSANYITGFTSFAQSTVNAKSTNFTSIIYSTSRNIKYALFLEEFHIILEYSSNSIYKYVWFLFHETYNCKVFFNRLIDVIIVCCYIQLIIQTQRCSCHLSEYCERKKSICIL